LRPMASSSTDNPDRRRLMSLTTRSRTQDFFKYRESLKTHRKAARGMDLERKDFKIHKNLLGGQGQSDDEGSNVDARVYEPPPVWVTLVDDLNRDVASIERKVAELQTLSGKHLLPSFGDDEEKEHEEEIAETVQEISSLFKACEHRLQEVARATDAGDGDEVQAVRENIKRRVAKQLQDLSLEFRRGHKNYLAKLKGQQIEDFTPDLKLNSPQGGASGGAFFDDDPSTPECIDPRFSAQQTLQLVMAEQMSKEREKAITSVAENVTELAEIFKEIQVLVIDQGTVLDRIDFNIEQASDRVGLAVKELNKANEISKRSKTMLCIYLLLLLCGLMVVVLVLKKSL